MLTVIKKNKNMHSKMIRRIWERIRILKIERISWSLARAVFIIGFCFVIIFPVLNMLSLAFMDRSDLFDNTVYWIPKNFTLDNIRTVMLMIDYPVALRNSIMLSITTTALQTISCMVVGYGFARFDFQFKKLLFGLVLLTIIVPPQLIMIPLYLHFRFFDIFGIIKTVTGNNGVNLLDSVFPFMALSLTANGIRNGLFIYIFRQFYRGIPLETEEAALVDGAGPIRTFGKIMIPSSVTIIVTIALFSFVWQWNDTLYSNLFLSQTRVLSITYSQLSNLTPEMLTSGTSAFSNQDIINPFMLGMLKSTGVFMIMIPLIALYFFAQRFFVESIERSGIIG